MTVANLPATVPAGGGRFDFSVSTGASCTWSARTDVTWADTTPGSGQGNGIVALQVASHARTDDSRTMTLTINTQSFRIVQAAASCTYALSTHGVQARNEGGRLSVRVSAGDGCAWSASAGNSWITVATPGGSGTDYVYLDIAPNTGAARQGEVTIAGQRVMVAQDAG